MHCDNHIGGKLTFVKKNMECQPAIHAKTFLPNTKLQSDTFNPTTKLQSNCF